MTNAWTTPDVYKGELHDPMSQKAYMWNNNNPVVYSDPTGYEAACVSINQQCISSSAATQIGTELANLFDALIGSDLRTLADRHAALGTRIVAGAMLASNLFDFGPGLKVIEKLADIEGLRSATLLDRLPDLGSRAANAAQNIRVIENEMQKGTSFLDINISEDRYYPR